MDSLTCGVVEIPAGRPLPRLGDEGEEAIDGDAAKSTTNSFLPEGDLGGVCSPEGKGLEPPVAASSVLRLGGGGDNGTVALGVGTGLRDRSRGKSRWGVDAE